MADQPFVTEDISTWEQVYYPPGGASQQPVAYTKRNIPYTASPNILQNLTVYVPIFGHNHKNLAAYRADERKGLWIVYVHGGAWRDPTITAASFDNGASHLLAPPATEYLRASGRGASIAGVVSLNYSLSPHPEHPFSDANQSDARARSAAHPQHLLDVLAAISLLQTQLHIGSRYLLAGHSCGSAMVLQAGAMQCALRDSLLVPADFPQIVPPVAIAGLNGLYDLPALVDRPGVGFDHLKPSLKEFVEGAFGTEDRAWAAASPAVARKPDGASWLPDWPGRLIEIVHSPEDEMVSTDQPTSFLTSFGCALPAAGWTGGDVETEYHVDGKTLVMVRATRIHHALWEDATELTDIFLRAVVRLGKQA